MEISHSSFSVWNSRIYQFFNLLIIMKFIVFALVLACAACYASREGTDFYCGRNLAITIANLCYKSEAAKRDAGWWLPPQGVRALGGVRGKRGPVDECCEKPCSLNELLSYC